MEKIDIEKMKLDGFVEHNEVKYPQPDLKILAEKINEIIDWSRKFEDLDSE